MKGYNLITKNSFCKPTSRNNSLLKCFFTVYCIFLAILLFGRTVNYGDMTYSQILAMNKNLIPFDTISYYVGIIQSPRLAYLHKTAVINLAGNVIMFIPLGFFLPAIFEKAKKFLLFLAIYTAIIISVELIQWFTLLGFCDVDDLILNVAGGVIGFILFKLFTFAIKSKKNKS